MTDKREMRTSAKSLNAGSALISASASLSAASPSKGASARSLAVPGLVIRFSPRALFPDFGIWLSCCETSAGY